MYRLLQRAKGVVTGRDGFVLPVVIFALVIMSTVAVVILRTSVDEQYAARAVRQSAGSFYAAEAGVSAVRNTWGDTTATLGAQIKALVPGDTLVVGGGWQKLTNGSQYRATVMRLDTAGQQLFLLSVEGRDTGVQGGQSAVSLVLTPGAGGPLKLGACCDAAVTIRGEVKVEDTGTLITGFDTTPPYGWDAAGACDGIAKADKPGVIIKDKTQITGDYPSKPLITGDPQPVVQDPMMNDSTFQNYGGLNYAQLKAMANHSIGVYGSSKYWYWGGDPKTDMTKFGPSLVGGKCNKADPLNFGSNNPSSPCFDYWPIIVTKGDVALRGPGGYAQGIFVLDIDPTQSPPQGQEFDLENGGGLIFAGIIVGMGCVEIEDGNSMYGAVFVDGNFYNNPKCGSDPPLFVKQGSFVKYSSCVVQRALTASGVGKPVTVQGPGGMAKIKQRSFAQVLR